MSSKKFSGVRASQTKHSLSGLCLYLRKKGDLCTRNKVRAGGEGADTTGSHRRFMLSTFTLMQRGVSKGSEREGWDALRRVHSLTHGLKGWLWLLRDQLPIGKFPSVLCPQWWAAGSCRNFLHSSNHRGCVHINQSPAHLSLCQWSNAVSQMTTNIFILLREILSHSLHGSGIWASLAYPQFLIHPCILFYGVRSLFFLHKDLLVNARDTRGVDLISGLGRSPGVGNGNLLQYSCLENPMEREAL